MQDCDPPTGPQVVRALSSVSAVSASVLALSGMSSAPAFQVSAFRPPASSASAFPASVSSVTSPAVLSVVLLTVTLVIAVPLARSAATRWAGERAGRAYGLTEDYRAAALRATASAVVLVTGAALAIALPLGAGRPGPGRVTASGAVPAAPAVATARLRPHVRRPGERLRLPRTRREGPGRPMIGPSRHPGRPSAAGDPRFATAPPARESSGATRYATTRPAPAEAPRPAAAARTIGLPAGGVLEQLADGTRIWLPPQYAYPSAASLAFPVVVAYLPTLPPVPARLQRLYPAFARTVAEGGADPFVIVQPPDCSGDPESAVAEASRRFRVMSGRGSRGVVGVGAMASCAIRAALARPDYFGAAVGISGTYDRAVPPLSRNASAPRPRLMLATGAVERSRRASALRLRTVLRRTGARVRLVDGVAADRRQGGGEWHREMELAAEYLTEQLDGPARIGRAGHLIH